MAENGVPQSRSNDKRDLVGLLEDLENEVQIAGQMIEAARLIAQAHKFGDSSDECSDRQRPTCCDPIQAVLLEALEKIQNAQDTMSVFERLDWFASINGGRA